MASICNCTYSCFGKCSKQTENNNKIPTIIRPKYVSPTTYGCGMSSGFSLNYNNNYYNLDCQTVGGEVNKTSTGGAFGRCR